MLVQEALWAKFAGQDCFAELIEIFDEVGMEMEMESPGCSGKVEPMNQIKTDTDSWQGSLGSDPFFATRLATRCRVGVWFYRAESCPMNGCLIGQEHRLADNPPGDRAIRSYPFWRKDFPDHHEACG